MTSQVDSIVRQTPLLYPIAHDLCRKLLAKLLYSAGNEIRQFSSIRWQVSRERNT